MNKSSTSNTGYMSNNRLPLPSFQANSNQQEYYFVSYKKSICDFKKVSFTTTHKKTRRCNSVIMEYQLNSF